MGMPFSWSTSRTPMWAMARPEAPERAIPTFGKAGDLFTSFIYVVYYLGYLFRRVSRHKALNILSQIFLKGCVPKKFSDKFGKINRGERSLVYRHGKPKGGQEFRVVFLRTVW